MIPPKPLCLAQSGLIQCSCAGKPDRNECVDSRYFWIAAETVANAATDQDRKGIIAPIAMTRGNAYAQDVRQAAWQLMQEAKQGDLLAAA